MFYKQCWWLMSAEDEWLDENDNPSFLIWASVNLLPRPERTYSESLDYLLTGLKRIETKADEILEGGSK